MKKAWFLIMLCLLVNLVFAVPVYVDIPVQNSQGMGLRRVITSAGVITDSQTYPKSYLRGLTSADTSANWGKIWFQFDLTDVWATYGKEKLVSAKLKIWSENGNTRRFSVAGLNDGIGESWTMAGITWTNAPGNNVASGIALDTTKIFNAAPLWTVQTAATDSIAVNLTPNDDGGDFDQCASYESINGPVIAANTNIYNFLATDTDGKVTLIAYDHTNSSSQNWWAGISGLYAGDLTLPNPLITSDARALRLRDSVTLTLRFPPLGADNPSPYPGSVVETNLGQLSWTNPDPNDGVSPITCTVYLGTEPNRPQMDSITLAPGATSVAINTTNFPTYGNLQNLTTYYWTVDCDDPSEPNLIEGLMWNFRADNNAPPVVNAGPDQDVWLPDPNGVLVNLNGTVTDDGKPVPPGALTYLWTQVSGPVVAITPNTVVDTSVTLIERGTYEFQLASNDGGAFVDQTDRVVIVVGTNACDASHIRTGAGYYSGDFNTDCIVDMQDFVVMAASWLNCTDTVDNCGN